VDLYFIEVNTVLRQCHHLHTTRSKFWDWDMVWTCESPRGARCGEAYHYGGQNSARNPEGRYQYEQGARTESVGLVARVHLIHLSVSWN
jgi:hypothetical protein